MDVKYLVYLETGCPRGLAPVWKSFLQSRHQMSQFQVATLDITDILHHFAARLLIDGLIQNMFVWGPPCGAIAVSSK